MAATKDESVWSLGLKGISANVSNMTAVAIMCGMFWAVLQNHMESAKEERVMFQQEMTQQRAEYGHNIKEAYKEHAKDREATAKIAEAVQVLASEIREIKKKDK